MSEMLQWALAVVSAICAATGWSEALVYSSLHNISMTHSIKRLKSRQHIFINICAYLVYFSCQLGCRH